VSYAGPPIGDPEGIRAFAALLSQQADALAERAEVLGKAATELTYMGPAADRFREDMAGHRSRAVGVAGELRDLANSMARIAADVEAQIQSWLQAQSDSGP
jgi:hypothetical protein